MIKQGRVVVEPFCAEKLLIVIATIRLLKNSMTLLRKGAETMINRHE
jgi:hypothetical protein